MAKPTVELSETTEIRKLPALAVFNLSHLLDPGNLWKIVMALIPSDPNNMDSDLKYTPHHIRLVEATSKKTLKSATEIMLDEWGTSGEVRPTLNTLLQVLIKANLYRSAEYVSVDLLKGKPPQRPKEGPCAFVDLPPLIDDTAGSDSVMNFTYESLASITNNFNETPVVKCVHDDNTAHYIGHKLGSGAFGTVYYAQLDDETHVAVKKLNACAKNVKVTFENEFSVLLSYKHPTLVRLLGYSCETPDTCLVFEFMANGSLLDRLQMNKLWIGVSTCNKSKNHDETLSADEPLTWVTRMNIAKNVCEAIHYLHTNQKFPVIHRDVKSANVLLDDKMFAKLGDFGLVKIRQNLSESKMLTSTVLGTSAYMAPEAFRGDVSVKMDVFSFGVVLLELLTGLPPYDEEREGFDLVTHIEDALDDSIEPLLDKKAKNWDLSIAQQLFILAQNCLEEKKTRPFIEEVNRRLGDIWSNIPTAQLKTE